MTQQEKQFLLKDLCARLPYGVKINIKSDYTREMEDTELTPYHIDGLGYNAEYKYLCPYLRPMSSMTEDEKKIMRSYGFEPILYDTGYMGFANIECCIDEVSFRFMEEFLNAHHFDYRGLIDKGLALEAPMDMYK